MCLGMLKDSEWKPSTKIIAVLEFARQLLKGVFRSSVHVIWILLTRSTEPNPDDAVEGKIADQYRTDKASYEKEAKDWCKRYASQKK